MDRMDPAARLNRTLERTHPAAFRGLSDLGRRIYFPVDIPAQSAEARGCAINATIGEVTDGSGNPLVLAALRERVPDLDPKQVFLYSAQGGDPELRRLWGARLSRHGAVPATLPLVSCGITHGLSLVGDLFVDPDTTVLLPRPGWGNYRLIFGVRRGGRVVPYNVVTPTGLDLDGIADALAQVQGKALLLLNFPSNPTGYSPSIAEIQALVALLVAHPGPLTVVLDDAYQDMVWEPGHLPRSLFFELANADPGRLLVVKLDGATKELFFFGARVGFLTFLASGEAGDALTDKARGMLRATVSAMPGPSQALVRAALQHPDIEAQRAATLAEVQRRYHALKSAMHEFDLPHLPFNSAFFALVPVKGDADAIRRRLIAEASVGVVSFQDFGALRLGYGSLRLEDVRRLVEAVRERI